MLKPNSKGDVSVFRSIGAEIMKQAGCSGNIFRNASETTDLKDLAFKVLERNNLRNKPETKLSDNVSQTEKGSDADAGNNAVLLDMYYWFQERAGIYEFDAGMSKEQAERRAYEDTIQFFSEGVAGEGAGMAFTALIKSFEVYLRQIH